MRYKTKIKAGLRKNKVVIVVANSSSYFEKSGKLRWKSIVQCDCNNQFEINNNYLLREPNVACKQCSFNDNCIVPIGSKFDKLTVVNYDNNIDKRGKRRCVCICECGNTMSIRPSSLKTNIKNNCGCTLRHGTYVGKLSKDVFNKMRHNASVRSITFEVDMEYLWSLYEHQNGKCTLSGTPIEFGEVVKDGRTASIDRIDSSKGYVVGNVQWVHKNVNRMKWDINQDKFIQLCKLVSVYTAKQNEKKKIANMEKK